MEGWDLKPVLKLYGFINKNKIKTIQLSTSSLYFYIFQYSGMHQLHVVFFNSYSYYSNSLADEPLARVSSSTLSWHRVGWW